ncbi:probable ubiquitin carboxyl-terminal hydrolase MINDY-4 [Heteronotia binoei]|uniref:probable ubiquitin carboxyl-terminal hydrolase MINDY-4 n=1 Tax=Heteronotia binoei TaxID=13085 RepID=UPI00292F7CED|nr:probable ubiquitin carboxyl-terminal hydrolase MINDY-4 [Heteronotia binoei]
MSEGAQDGVRSFASSHDGEANEKSYWLNRYQRPAGDGSEKKERSPRKSETGFSDCRKTLMSISSHGGLGNDALELVDVEDEGPAVRTCKIPDPSALFVLQVKSKPIDFSLAKDLKILLFGSSLGCFSEEWKIQSFVFSDVPELKYGIVQKKGGPCGVLAAVQGCVLRRLIFGGSGRIGGDPWTFVYRMELCNEKWTGTFTVDVEDEGPAVRTCKIPDPSALFVLQVKSKPIDFSLAKDLKILLFGSSLGCFSEEWKIQSFVFSDVPELKYGIVQKKGGPCGVLAAVQGCVLRRLIFGGSGRIGGDPCKNLHPSEAQRTECLALALADILWRAGGSEKATVALCTGTQQFTPAGKYKADGVLETVMLHVVTKYEDLLGFLQQNIYKFEAGPHGAILLTLSAILSRSIHQVRRDFDVTTNRLIGAHGYCTQELVNLLLTGKAASNVFNDVIELDSGNGNTTVLKGVSGRSEVGLLSLFEHYDVCQVGCYLKTPKFPIWLVCSESHFSILFSTRKDLLGDWKTERRFDLYYYDGLANQQEEIRLTVDTSQPYLEDQESDLVPPLEHCIRTKWTGAVVNWNGTEPIL